jgi:hypothetical protein
MGLSPKTNNGEPREEYASDQEMLILHKGLSMCVVRQQ